MGGYYSGRKASNQPSIETFYSLEVCELYRLGALEPGVTTVYQYNEIFSLNIECKEDVMGWPLCLMVRYLVRNTKGKIFCKNQTIGLDFVSVLKGKARRPYFFCPRMETRVGTLILGGKGFAHRSYYAYLYDDQRKGHIDRALSSARRIKEKLNCLDGGALTDPPVRPKGMHWRTFRRYLWKHQKLTAPLLEKFGDII